MNKENNYKATEKEILRRWKKSGPAKRHELLAFFNRQIEFLQHERLIHLLITLFFGGFSLLLGCLAPVIGSIFVFAVFLVLIITTCFYVAHYYFLENTCQRWQSLALKLEKDFLVFKKKS